MLHQQPRRRRARALVPAGRVATASCSAVVLNSGGANACTGPEGFADTHADRRARRRRARRSPRATSLVCSTGLIGERLPIDSAPRRRRRRGRGRSRADGGGRRRRRDHDHRHRAQDGRRRAATGRWSVGGMAKGAGMLAPGLATMLCVLTTDAAVDAEDADAALRAATRDDVRPGRLRRLHVDQRHRRAARLRAPPASRSTRDELTAGAHRRPAPSSPARSSPTPRARATTSRSPSRAPRTEDAGRRRRPRRDPLQPVQGRGVRQRPELGPGARRRSAPCRTTSPRSTPTSIDVTINGVQVCRAGGVGDDRVRASTWPPTARCTCSIDLHAGDAEATVWTNDLTHDYVHENSAYSS